MSHTDRFKLLLIVIISMLLASSSVFSQAKVGTSGAQFLEMSFSARSSSLGQCGVTLIDENSALSNPGALALFYADRRANLSMMIPLRMNGGHSLRAGSIGYGFTVREAAPSRSRLILAFAYNRISLKTGWMPVRTYENGPGDTGQGFHANDKAEYITAAIAWEGRVRVGLGLSLLKIDELYYNDAAEGTALNLGFLIEAPFKLSLTEANEGHYRFTPSIGLALLNYGKDLKMISTTYPLPKKFNVGYGLKLERIVNSLTTLSARLLLEKHYDLTPTKPKNNFHIGTEFGFYNTLNIRLGSYSIDGKDRFTYGIGTNLSGLIDTFTRWNLLQSKSALTRLSEKIDISYNYGKLEDALIGPNGYHQLSISLK